MLSLLIVGNDPQLVDLLTMIFGEPEFDVEHAGSIDAARQSLARQPFDVVLVDPGPFIALHSSILVQLRELVSSAPARTVFGMLTTSPSRSRCSPAEIGFRFVVTLPFDVDDLKRAVLRAGDREVRSSAPARTDRCRYAS